MKIATLVLVAVVLVGCGDDGSGVDASEPFSVEECPALPDAVGCQATDADSTCAYCVAGPDYQGWQLNLDNCEWEPRAVSPDPYVAWGSCDHLQ